MNNLFREEPVKVKGDSLLKNTAVCPVCGNKYQYFSHYRKPLTCNLFECLYQYFCKLKNIPRLERKLLAFDSRPIHKQGSKQVNKNV